jgi:hypothetical protein
MGVEVAIMRTFFLFMFLFLNILTACKEQEPTPIVVKDTTFCEKSSEEDGEWTCSLQPTSTTNFKFQIGMIYRGVIGVDHSLTIQLPDGWTLVFLSTIRCRGKIECLPYVARLIPPPQARMKIEEFPGWVIRLDGTKYNCIYTRVGKSVTIEFDGVEKDRFEFQLPSQYDKKWPPIPVTIQGHGLWAEVHDLKLTPLP